MFEVIKGAALGERTLVDVCKLFSYVVEKMPERAKVIIGIQRQMLRQFQTVWIDIGLGRKANKLAGFKS